MSNQSSCRSSRRMFIAARSNQTSTPRPLFSRETRLLVIDVGTAPDCSTTKTLPRWKRNRWSNFAGSIFRRRSFRNSALIVRLLARFLSVMLTSEWTSRLQQQLALDRPPAQRRELASARRRLLLERNGLGSTLSRRSYDRQHDRWPLHTLVDRTAPHIQPSRRQTVDRHLCSTSRKRYSWQRLVLEFFQRSGVFGCCQDQLYDRQFWQLLDADRHVRFDGPFDRLPYRLSSRSQKFDHHSRSISIT